jgi:hypothetical protein
MRLNAFSVFMWRLTTLSFLVVDALRKDFNAIRNDIEASRIIDS